MENRLALALFLTMFVAAHLAVFVVSMVRSAPSGIDPFRQLGRAFGACISLDGALILFPVMRRLSTWVRATWLGRLLPIDDAIDFHRWVGHTMFFCALGHGGSLLAAYASGHHDATTANFFLHTQRGLTGTLILAVFLMMWLFALEPIRRSRLFELFYFSHLLYVAWFVLVLVHAPTFAFYAGIPLFFFAIEQLVRLFRRGKRSVLVKGAALRSGVTRLDIQRPPKMTQRPGDYVFLNIPAIAAHEWHPFTLSNAPENEHLTVHVRTLGNWTSALRRHIELRETQESPLPLPIKIDGPYGAPTTHVFESRFAVLIAGGIGVTPFASILESIVRRASSGPSKLEKVHFFWLNRDQYSFEWFTALLTDLEELDRKAMLEVHLCMTSGRTGATAVGLEMAREIMHEEGRRDLVTGLRTLTHMGHPDWDTVLDGIVAQHAPATVDVYFCGPRGLGQKLEALCRKRKMPFREERF